ncbi:hypothetical protein BDR07DRAFT_1386453 [Suillus spraguei]|nr:hypothetical protein BDR07DRAFT_1386453 [Suillus spraguei]
MGRSSGKKRIEVSSKQRDGDDEWVQMLTAKSGRKGHGTSIIDKQDIRTMRSHRVVVLSQGPDLASLRTSRGLARLGLWLVDALRDRLPGTKIGGLQGKGKKSLPFVVACLNEKTQTYMWSVSWGHLTLGMQEKRVWSSIHRSKTAL